MESTLNGHESTIMKLNRALGKVTVLVRGGGSQRLFAGTPFKLHPNPAP